MCLTTISVNIQALKRHSLESRRPETILTCAKRNKIQARSFFLDNVVEKKYQRLYTYYPIIKYLTSPPLINPYHGHSPDTGREIVALSRDTGILEMLTSMSTRCPVYRRPVYRTHPPPLKADPLGPKRTKGRLNAAMLFPRVDILVSTYCAEVDNPQSSYV